MKIKHWTPKEKRMLSQFVEEQLSAFQMSQKLDRTEQAVRKKLDHLGYEPVSYWRKK